MTEEYSDNELEKRLQGASQDFRLQARQKVWKGIRDELHPRRRAYPVYVTAAVLLLLAAGLYVGRHIGTSTESASVQRTKALPAIRMAGAPDASFHRPAGPDGEEAMAGRPAGASHAPAVPVAVPAVPVRAQNRLVAETKTATSSSAAASVAYLRDIRLPVLDGSSADFASLVVDSLQVLSLLEVPATPVPDSLQRLVEDDRMARKGNQRTGVRRKAAFGMFFTPGAGYRMLKSEGGSQTVAAYPRLSLMAVQQPPQTVKLRQKADFGWTAGVEVMLPLGGPWLFRSGLSVSRSGYRLMAYDAYPAYVRDNGTVSYAAVNGNNNSYYAAARAQAMSRRPSWVHIRYLTAAIPLMLAAEFGEPGKVTYTLTGGAGIGWLLSSDPLIYSPDSKRYFEDRDYVRRFRTSLHLEALVNVPLQGPLQISAGPSLQYQLSSSYRNYPQVKEHPYLIGISAGLQWRR